MDFQPHYAIGQMRGRDFARARHRWYRREFRPRSNPRLPGAFRIAIDEARNAAGQRDTFGAPGAIAEIQRDDNPVKILVVPTDEKGEIARQTPAPIQR